MGEFVGFATGHPLLAVVVLLITAFCGVLRSWISHRTVVRHEIEATRRAQLAVEGTNSTNRAAVVRACAELEAASHPLPTIGSTAWKRPTVARRRRQLPSARRAPAN